MAVLPGGLVGQAAGGDTRHPLDLGEQRHGEGQLLHLAKVGPLANAQHGPETETYEL